MTEPRKPVSAAWYVGIALAGLLVLYMAAYYLLLKPVDKDLRWNGKNGAVAPVYSEDAAWDARLTRFFAPFNRLDRRIRPHVWEP